MYVICHTYVNMISLCARFRCPDAQTLENTQWKGPIGGYVRMVNGPDNVRFALGSTRKMIMHVCCKNVYIFFFRFNIHISTPTLPEIFVL